jgi:cell division septation protein DedD
MRNTGICLVAIVLGMGLAGCNRESADWKSASAADTAEAYQQFLQQHPRSGNAVQAQARIQQIADDRDWQAAAAADTRDAYERFVAQHADSKWAQEARIRIENFAQSGGAGAAAAATPAVKPVTASAPAVAATKAAPRPSGPTRRASSGKPAVHGAPSTQVASAAEHGHFVQLGAFHSKARAEAAWKSLLARYPSELKSLQPHYVAAKSRSGPVYKLRVSVSSASDAKGLCATLKKHALICVPVA